MPLPTDAWRHVQFKLDLNAYAKLEALLKQHGLRNRDELIAQLAAAA